MAAINETITTSRSSEFTPTKDVSFVSVQKTGRGNVLLQAKAPSGSWQTVWSGSGVFTVNTPDYGVVYSFIADGDAGSINVYMGP